MIFLGHQIPDTCYLPHKEKCTILNQLITSRCPPDLSPLKTAFSLILRELKAFPSDGPSDLILCFAHLSDPALARNISEVFDEHAIASVKEVQGSCTDDTPGPYGYIYLKNVAAGSPGIYYVHRVLLVLLNGTERDSKRFHFEALFRYGTSACYTNDFLAKHFAVHKEMVFKADGEYEILTTREKSLTMPATLRSRITVKQYQVCDKSQPGATRWMDRSQVLRYLGKKGEDLLKGKGKMRNREESEDDLGEDRPASKKVATDLIPTLSGGLPARPRSSSG